MKTAAFVFPGQGAQKIGMGLDFFEHSDIAKEYYCQADDILGFSLSDLCFRGSEDELVKTVNTQPAIYVLSVIAWRILEEKGIKPEVAAGHSVGEYAALTAAGVLSFEQGLKLVRERGRLMHEAGLKAPGTMAAIIGLDYENVKKCCMDSYQAGTVEIANFNSPEQIVISGEIPAVERAMELIKAKGARRVIPLKVGAAFHSGLMADAAEQFAKVLDNADFSEPKFPVVANATAELLKNAEDMRVALKKQMLGSVLWVDSVKEMAAFGSSLFIEAGQ